MIISVKKYYSGQYTSSGWRWLTGEDFSAYTKWTPTQPDNYLGQEDKLMMYRNTNPLCTSGTFGYWNDLNNDGTCNGEAFFGLNNFGFIYEKDSYKPKTYYTVIGNNFKKLTLVSPLKRGAWTNSDTDSLTDWQEFDSGNSMLAWNSDNEPVLPTLKTVLKLKGDVRISNELTRELNGLDDYLDVVRIAPFLSDPTVEDTDEDGYDDYSELIVHNSDSLKSNIELLKSISQQEYVQITANDGNTYFGGNQAWSSNDLIQNYGCGLVASCDILIYLGKSRSCEYLFVPSILYNSDGTVNYNTYCDFLQYYYENYFNFTESDHTRGTRLVKSLEKYMCDYGMSADVYWGNLEHAYDYPDFIVDMLLNEYSFNIGDFVAFDIIRMLDSDIPAMLSIGPKSPGILLYSSIENIISDHVTSSTKDHYVTVTAVYSDSVSNDLYFEISSWGKKYYISYKEFLEVRDIYSGVTNIRF